MKNDVATSPQTGVCSPAMLGIWRVGERVHGTHDAELAWAQPADAAASPRWDYVVKWASGPQLDPEGRQQIRRFITAATAVSHPNLVPVLDGSDTGATPYLVMPRLEGQSLLAWLGSRQSRPLPVALWFARQTAQALVAMHEAGWVHGDLEPGNVLVGPRGHITLIDLGAATPVHTAFSPVFRGTRDYASPELVAGQTAALPGMDMFSLGRLLWQSVAHVDSRDQHQLDAVAELIEHLVADDPLQRPTARDAAATLLQLEIQTLGGHMGPGSTRHRAA